MKCLECGKEMKQIQDPHFKGTCTGTVKSFKEYKEKYFDSGLRAENEGLAWPGRNAVSREHPRNNYFKIGIPKFFMGAVLPEVAAVGACAAGHSWCQALQISLQAIAYWLIFFSWCNVFITITTPNHNLVFREMPWRKSGVLTKGKL